jgi:hypothetical protein
MKVACAETLKPSVADGRTFEADASVRRTHRLFRRLPVSTFPPLQPFDVLDDDFRFDVRIEPPAPGFSALSFPLARQTNRTRRPSLQGGIFSSGSCKTV